MPISQFSPDSIEADHQKLYWRQPVIIASPTPDTTTTPHPLKHKSLFLPQPNNPSSAQINKMSQEETLISSPSSVDINIGEEEELEEEEEEREQMFEKPLTPSDVGKLNRLVIPKQHAEKYFPLGGGDRVDSAEKGALLSFEDESGKSWRFRYSYWNSSQSYVLTKGWSRYVKEKRLDAGDVVSFQRCRRPFDGQRFFIRWRRGGSATPMQDNQLMTLTNSPTNTAAAAAATWTQLYFTTTATGPYPTHHHHHPPLHHQYSHHHHHHYAGVAVEPVVETQQRGSWKRLRLFGVNLECQQDESEPEGSSPFGSSLSSQGQTTHLFYSQAHGSTSHA